MLKLLLKKQLTEIFKAYFYDAKKNKKRSKAGTVGWFVFYCVAIVGILGGMFTSLAVTICGALTQAGMAWMYFLLMSGISIVLGAFGSVFNTFSGLYLSKDNDLLLSMPIPVKFIIISRLLSVYLLGTLYSSVVILPSLIVYWTVILPVSEIGKGITTVLCGLLLDIIISFIVLILSCLLGWCVAKISLKIKKKSFITVLASLTFIGLYYFVYFKAQELIQTLLANAAVYGDKIKGSAYILYLFGKAGEGDISSTALFIGVTALLLLLTWLVLKKTFLSIAISSGKTVRTEYKEKSVKQKSVYSALLNKEFSKFVSSPAYMLNCGLGILLVPVFGVILLIKGSDLIAMFASELPEYISAVPVVLCTLIFLTASTFDIAAPSVSLEAHNIWILQSLPVEPKKVLGAKTAMHFILSILPVMFTAACSLTIMNESFYVNLIFLLIAFVYSLFMAEFSSFLGIMMPNLTWTNEIIPIKQGSAVMVSLFGGWGIAAVFALLYFALRNILPTSVYLTIWVVVLVVSAVIMKKLLDTKGAKRLSEI